MYTMHNDSGETELTSADEAAGHLLAEIQDDYMNGRFSAFYGPDDEPVRFEITVRVVPRPENQA